MSARRISAANGARLAGCTVGDLDVVVTVAVEARLGVLGDRTAEAAARAGPVGR